MIIWVWRSWEVMMTPMILMMMIIHLHSDPWETENLYQHEELNQVPPSGFNVNIFNITVFTIGMITITIIIMKIDHDLIHFIRWGRSWVRGWELDGGGRLVPTKEKFFEEINEEFEHAWFETQLPDLEIKQECDWHMDGDWCISEYVIVTLKALKMLIGW